MFQGTFKGEKRVNHLNTVNQAKETPWESFSKEKVLFCMCIDELSGVRR